MAFKKLALAVSVLSIFAIGPAAAQVKLYSIGMNLEG
jgi:hypothetical protein